MCAHVVVAEDDTKQAELIRRYLEHESHAVTLVQDGRAALDEIRRRLPDLLVLDVMMPGLDGLSVCRTIRSEAGLEGLPVLMLTARSTEDDLLLGLDLGADDYLTKPFSPRELMARIRSLLRRSGRDRVSPAAAGDTRESTPGGDLLAAGAVTVDPARHEVWARGRKVSCTPGEFRLLEVLAGRPGQVFTRSQILERLHGFDRYITTRTVDVHVMNLRKKLEANPRRPTSLVTVYGVGYKLADDPRPSRPALGERNEP
ncbi:response regulator transcription factor [Streptomyces anthocyanicus]|uniref:response regulator transcription factor n=1 Tax=Streptomyces anthocyanicus TaxID=68174 RepID=UPI002F91699E|nr:response regulator transcription factor [Streptomyces anthocyanicus]